MPIERTLSIIKPDAVAKNIIGRIIDRFEREKLRIVAARFQRLSYASAAEFYAVHRTRPFFKDLAKFMSSGSVFVQVLEGTNAVQKNREIMGDTDPRSAAPGTIRADFASSIGENAVHGSDSLKAAATEIAFFFPELSASI